MARRVRCVFDAAGAIRQLRTEGNPLLRPFAHSNALYAVTQISPAVMDLIGKRMMVSQNRLVRVCVVAAGGR